MGTEKSSKKGGLRSESRPVCRFEGRIEEERSDEKIWEVLSSEGLLKGRRRYRSSLYCVLGNFLHVNQNTLFMFIYAGQTFEVQKDEMIFPKSQQLKIKAKFRIHWLLGEYSFRV